MSWRGSTGHLDGNVPDYQKMQFSRYPSSGWSSMQTGLSGLSGRSQSSSYLAPRNRHSYVESSRLSGRPNSPPYQPSKYGLPSDLGYNSTTGDGGYRNSNFDEDVFNTDNGYDRRSNSGYMGQEFDFGPYRSNSQRALTDYSSDTGGGYRSNAPHNVDYSSDSGRGHVSRHLTDYSSDSGMSYRHQRRKSVELEMPSPVLSRKERMASANEDLFSSPVKVRPSEYQRIRDNIPQASTSRHTFEANNHVSSHGRTSPPDSPRNTSHDNLHLLPEVKSQSESHNSISNHEHSFDHDTHNQSHEHLHDLDRLHTHEIDQIQSHDHILANDNETIQSGRSAANHMTSSHDTNNIDSRSHDIGQINSHNSSPRNNPESEESESRLDFMSPPLYRGRNATGEQPRVTKKPPTHKASDLTHWQQRQRIQDTHIDKTDQPPYRNPHRHINYDSHDHYVRRDQISPREPKTHQSHDHFVRHDQISPREPKSQQLESIKSAADAIIRDKDAKIDDLRRQLVGQEETIKEYENKLRRTLMSRSADQGEVANFSKMKDLEYRNAQLRTQVANLKLQKEAEIEELEIKMGGVEHEVVELRAALRKSQPSLAETQDKLQQKDREIEEWKKKFTGLKESHGSLKEQLDSLERYIADLPAPEEFGKTADELAAYKEENQLKKEQIESLEERLKETTELLSEKEITVQDLENKQQHLATKMKELTTEIQYIKSEGEGRALQQAQEDLQEALEVKERVTLDLEKAKKLLEINHRKVRQLEVKHQNEVRQLQERLQQEEESVVAFREEGRMKEQQMGKLKKSLKEFAGKNQDLMDENLILKDQIKQHEAMSADENQKLQRRFVSEMSICFSELQSLVQIIVQRAEGKEPDISLLLGMAGTTLEDEQGAVGGVKKDDTTLKHWFKKLKELRSEVEKIRKMICDKYANELGDNINCAQQ